MPRRVQFYSPERVTPQQAVSESRSPILEALLANKGDTRPAYGGVWEGVARVGSQVADAFAAKKLNEQEEERRNAIRETMTRALFGEPVDPAEHGEGITSQPITMESGVPDVVRTPTSRDKMARILAGNPDTANMSFQMKLADMEAQRQAQAEAAAGAAAHQRAIELKQTAPGRAPVPGTDTPLPDDVVKQRMAMALAGRSSPQSKAVNVRLPDGTITPGRKTPTGEIEYLGRDGSYKPAPFGASMAGVQLSGTEADADKVRARKFREYEDAASNFMQYGTGLVNAIDTGTPLFGTTGALARFTNSVRAQAEQIGRAFDGEEEAANIAQRMQPGSQTWDRLRQVVGDRADILGTGIALAYMRAKMLDPTGRVSDADLENSIKSLGFDTNDPSIIRRRIIGEMNFLNRSYQSRAQREQIGDTQRFNIPARKQEEKRKRLKDKYGLE